MSYTSHNILSAACCWYQIMEFFVEAEIKLDCSVLRSQIPCQLFFLVCYLFIFFFSVSRPKPLRRLLLRRSPWPWPTTATWICNPAAIPHEDALGLRQTPDRVQIVSRHVHHTPLIAGRLVAGWLFAVVPTVLQNAAHMNLLLKGDGALNFLAADNFPLRRRGNQSRTWIMKMR